MRARWMMAGGAAVVMAAGVARAMPGDQYDDTRYPDDASVQFEQPRTIDVAIDARGVVPGATLAARPGEEVRVIFTRTAPQDGEAEVVLPEHGIRAPLPVGKKVAITVRAGERGGVPYLVESAAPEAGR